MSPKMTALISATIALLFMLLVGNPAIYDIQHGDPSELPDHGGNAIHWNVPIFRSDDDRFYNTVTAITPTGITEDEYLASANDSDMIRNPLLDCGYHIPDCPQRIADGIREAVRSVGGDMDGYSDYRKCATIQSFVVTGFEYASDMDVYGCDDYAQTPVETLYLGTGDCEDKSILFVSVARAFGLISEPILYYEHCTAGVIIDGYGGSTVNGYVSIECTGMNLHRGLTPYLEDGGKVSWSEPWDDLIGHWIVYCNRTRDYNPIVLIWELLS